MDSCFETVDLHQHRACPGTGMPYTCRAHMLRYMGGWLLVLHKTGAKSSVLISGVAKFTFGAANGVLLLKHVLIKELCLTRTQGW